MKVVCVIDSIKNLNAKIQLLKSRFGEELIYIVDVKLRKLVETYGLYANAIYRDSLSRTIHITLKKYEPDDTIIYYTSVELNEDLLNKFLTKIGDKQKVVNIEPNYNAFERMSNAAYNLYVKSVFKLTDNLASPKMQFLPQSFVAELMNTHIANRMFKVEQTSTIYVENKAISKSLKLKNRFTKLHLIPIIIALVITIALILSIAFVGAKYVPILICTLFYLLDIFITIIFLCKNKFDTRFLK